MMNRTLDTLKRYYFAAASLAFVILLVRLGYLQLYNWDKYFRESEQNRIREIVVDADRGQLLDRNGDILVDNWPSYSVSVIPYEFLKSDTTITFLSSLIDVPSTDLIKRIQKEKISNFNPVRIKRQIGFKTLSALEENRLDLLGVFYNIESKRYYPGGVRAPHVFGYLDEITSDELTVRKKDGYRLGDNVGRTGLELMYENYLRGTAGVKYIEVDVLGREVRDLHELSSRSPVPGKNLYLTLDAPLQRFLEGRMAGKKGAAIAIDPRNGDVLAFVSGPDYSPELFSNPLSPTIWNSLINDEGHPLYNRASQSLFPPGSTFKLILAAAGLETGLIDTTEQVRCTGGYQFGRRRFKCWKVGGHGLVNLKNAIQQSCNVFFFKKSLDVGLANWSKYAGLFGFGHKTGIDLPDENLGLVPDKAYLDGRYGEKNWTRGQLLNLAVGQGDLLVTPLQMAKFAMIVGNEGHWFRPRLVRKVRDPLTNETIELNSPSFKSNQISRETYKILKEGMYLVVNGPRGTAHAARLSGVEVCGKTGTAQNPQGKSHAWFIGFAPREHPEIAFCIMVENGGGGGAVAAPIAGDMLKKFFESNNRRIARR